MQRKEQKKEMKNSLTSIRKKKITVNTARKGFSKSPVLTGATSASPSLQYYKDCFSSEKSLTKLSKVAFI